MTEPAIVIVEYYADCGISLYGQLRATKVQVVEEAVQRWGVTEAAKRLKLSRRSVQRIKNTGRNGK